MLGVLASAAVADVVGGHWRSARPEILFLLLRWAVAVLAGLGVAAVMRWWGEQVADSVHEGPLGWLDRAVGGFLGAVMGAVLATALLVVILQVPGLGAVRRDLARGVTPEPLLAAAVRVMEVGQGLPGGLWLRERLNAASRRLVESRDA